MTEFEALRAAGWEVVELSDRIRIRPADAMPDVAYAEVMKNEDGSLHFVKERSHFHRKLLADIAAANQPKEEAEYIASVYAEYIASVYGGKR